MARVQIKIILFILAPFLNFLSVPVLQTQKIQCNDLDDISHYNVVHHCGSQNNTHFSWKATRVDPSAIRKVMLLILKNTKQKLEVAVTHSSCQNSSLWMQRQRISTTGDRQLEYLYILLCRVL